MRLNSSILPIEREAWPEHQIRINAEKASERLAALRKRAIEVKGQPEVHCYEIVEGDGRRFLKSAEELIAAGYAEKNTAEDREAF